jgi:hypothetical protein
MRSRSSACHHLNMRTRTSVLGFLIASSRGLIAGAIISDRDCAAKTYHHIE